MLFHLSMEKSEEFCFQSLECGMPVPLKSCRILQFLTVRLPILSAFERHDSLPTSVGTHTRVPLYRGRHGTSNTGTAWCSLPNIVPDVCVFFPSLRVVVMVCGL